MRDVRSLFNLENRAALVTGGAGHIGSTIADAFAELGARVAIVDIQTNRAEAVADAIHKQRGVTTAAFTVDLEDENALAQLPERAAEKLGALDILVNCAALGGTSPLPGWAVPFEQQSVISWRRALEVNLTAAFILAQSSMNILLKNGHGSIINILSIYGLVAPDNRLYEGTSMGNPAAYGASKGGLLQLTRYLATEMAPRVRCNAITPGGVERGQPRSFRDQYIARTPLGRMAVEEDFKGAAAFLASDASAYVTGQNIVVDGGWTAW